jgi:hypothetical protein
MWAEIVDGAVAATRGRLPGSLRRVDSGAWVCPPDGSWSDVEAALCGWFQVAEVAAPAVTAAQVAEPSIGVVNGLPVQQWTIRAKTADELAADTATRVHGDLRTRMRAAVGDNAAYLAIGAPTNAQNLAQIRRLTRQMNALIRATVGGNLLVDSTDV